MSLQPKLAKGEAGGNSEKYINVFLFFLIPIDCFRDGSGLNALKIQKCLSEASFLNLAVRPEAARLETITGRPLLVTYLAA